MARTLMTSGLIAAAAAGGSSAHAAAWSFTPDTSLSAAWDDNVALTPAIPLSDYSGRTELSGTFARTGDRSRLTITPRFVGQAYEHQKLYSRTEEYLTLTDQRATERTSSNLTLNWTRDTTLTSELGYTGFSEVNKNHQLASLSWSPSWQESEKVAIGAQVYTSASRYFQAFLTRLVDYNYSWAALYSSYAVTPLSKLTLQAAAGRMKVPSDSRNDKNNHAFTLAYERSLAERWHMELSYGPSWIQNTKFHRVDRGDIYEFDLSRKSERGSLSLAISQQVTPNSTGVLSNRRLATLALERALSERLDLNIVGTASRTRNALVVGGLDSNELNYSDLSASLAWSLAPTWKVSLSAGETQQSYHNVPGTARRTHASLGINWDGLERVLH